jgi:ubiquinone/menaquinone biosynthesis C-methylase UbiE
MKALLKFSQDAEQIIQSYLDSFATEISKFEVRSEYLRMLTFDVEQYLRFFSIKHARNRSSNAVEKIDADYAQKNLGNPKRFVKSQFKDATTLQLVQNATLEFLAWTEKKLDEFQVPIVLDAGCGWGRQIAKLQNYYHKTFEMMGIDVDTFSLTYGRNLNALLSVVKSSIENLPIRNNSFNLILCSGVIHEIRTRSGRKGVISEFYRALKPNGALCIVDVFSANPVTNAVTRILQYFTSKVEWIFPRAQLEGILKENDFEAVNVKKTQSRLFGTIEGDIITATKPRQ